jgi:alkanesulfonate monooxygenase SsuD/methylene tetrahydromethanopterin reductase-like flavin-dependent oxidoreductase (luciferase family)
LLPLSSPLRVIEEICILDHLSRGRLDVGVGRGSNPFEYAFNKLDFAQSEARFADALGCLIEGLTHDRLTYAGPHYAF